MTLKDSIDAFIKATGHTYDQVLHDPDVRREWVMTLEQVDPNPISSATEADWDEVKRMLDEA